MNKLSFWAKSHTTAARLLMVCIHLLLLGLSLVATLLLGQTDSNETWVFLMIGIALYLFIVYPVKPLINSDILKYRYVFRKRNFNGGIGALGFLLYILVFTSENPVTGFYGSLKGSNSIDITVKPGDSSKKYLSLPDFNKQYHTPALSAKEKRQLLKNQVKAIQKDNGLSKSAKTWLLILTILVAVGLLYLLVGLSCSLSCAGSGTAAAIVMILGVPALVFLTIFVIRRIKGKRRRPKNSEPVPPQ